MSSHRGGTASGPVTLRDSWRLAAGTLTALPTAMPSRVDAVVARGCVLLAPAAVLPLGIGVVLVGLLAVVVDVPALVAAFGAVAVLALGSRVMHVDGLSDTVDGLTASYDRERSLAVMKTGTSGPAGVMATVVVAGMQAAALATLLTSWQGSLLAGVAVLASRGALALTCRRGVLPARRDGLGHPMAGVVLTGAAAALWVALAALLTGAGAAAGLPLWQPVLAALAAVATVLVLVRHTTRRLGGVTGDVYGAGVELALTALLVVLSAG
ncbi:adenosylcobinamide-GDP ribazoletransferase [Nocardioides yefusunii]|uniref:Adenosylcobinamide-GDP ribazoletransferase n=1 Tax=Nocardioides yefusunii TaxID=2500546 RepID=A0ABW1QUV0_9ACTN|nr:adenosylcobinamide-GDP ribazoletransferase [Nocardioides yefusunii]